MYGRFLIPVTMIVLGQAMWSDPVLGPQLAAGVEEIQPIMATYAQGTPLDGVFGPVPETASADDLATAINRGTASDTDALSTSFNLPASTRPVNRPEG